MNCTGIIRKYLEANGFDGLCGEECGCELSDLMPCEDYFKECEPGYKRKPTEEDVELFGECEWVMGLKKQEGQT